MLSSYWPNTTRIFEKKAFIKQPFWPKIPNCAHYTQPCQLYNSSYGLSLFSPFVDLGQVGDLSQLALHRLGIAVNPLQAVHVRVQYLNNSKLKENEQLTKRFW